MTTDRDAPSAEERRLVVEEQVERLMAMALEATDRQARIALVAFLIDPMPFEDWQASFDRREIRDGPEKAEGSADFFHEERTTRALRAATTIVDLLDCRSPLAANLPKPLGSMTETTFANGAKASSTLAARFLSRMPKR